MSVSCEQTIPAFFEAQASEKPAHLAAIFQEQLLTYQQLNERANQLAHYLVEQGVKTDTPIAICMSRSLDLLIATLAILKAGCAYLPLEAAHPIDRLIYQLQDNANPPLLIQAEQKALFKAYEGPLLILEDLPLKQASIANLSPQTRTIHPSNLAYIIYTSGSTGVPKGVLIEHQSVLNYCQWFTQYSGIQVQQRVDFSSPYVFDMTISTSLVALMSGLTVIVAPPDIKENCRDYLCYLDDQFVDLIKITPSYLRTLLHEIKNHFVPLSHLKTVVLGGENLTRADCEAWLALYPHHTLFNEYGPTEVTIAVTQCQVTSQLLPSFGETIPIGFPASHARCYLLDKNQLPVKTGETGMLYIGGESLARGYLNQPELTAARFIPSPFGSGRLYQTGDLCQQLPDGAFLYIGRVDDQQKIRGFRVELGEIETALITHPAIKESVVLVEEDPSKEKQLTAYYLLKEGFQEPSFHDLRGYLKTHLPDYMIPNAFIKVNAFPLTMNGKLDRNALSKMHPMHAHHGAHAKTELTKALTKIWSQELHINDLGVDDHFFELGGHSLIAARILSKITNQLGKKIELADFYQSPTIMKLAALLEKTPDSDETDPPSASPSLYQQALPLCDFQLMIWLSSRFEPKIKEINIISKRRLLGALQATHLNKAFHAVFHLHEALSFRPSLIRPLQFKSKQISFKLVEQSLHTLSQSEQEMVLTQSMNELSGFSDWKNHSPLLLAKLFYLSEEEAELQLCLPHIVCDEVSIDILFTDLSHYYQLYASHPNSPLPRPSQQLQHYLMAEQRELTRQANVKIAFWKQYLAQTLLFEFPPAVRLKPDARVNYSTYEPLSEKALRNLNQFCSTHHLSVMEGLCAVLVLTLINQTNYAGPNLFVNLVKSTRNNPAYDRTIGCFLRLEPLNLAIPKDRTLLNIAKTVHQAILETAPYQGCGGLVKASYLGTFNRRNHLRSLLIKLLSRGYRFLFGLPKHYQVIFEHSEKLSARDAEKMFLINLNVQNNFLQSPSKHKANTLFGLKQKKLPLDQRDLLHVNGVLDICFQRDDSNAPFLVISASLLPAFREQLARACHQMMCVELADQFDEIGV